MKNEKFKSKVGTSPLQTDNDIAFTDEDKANTFNKFYVNVFTWKNLDNVTKVELSSKSNSVTIPDMCITAEAVKRQLKNLNPNKVLDLMAFQHEY